MAKEMGRPRFPKGEALSDRITARVRPKEKAEIRAAAEAAEMTMADWLREVALAAARRSGAKKKAKSTRRRKKS